MDYIPSGATRPAHACCQRQFVAAATAHGLDESVVVRDEAAQKQRLECSRQLEIQQGEVNRAPKDW
jgi:hypothetical protein